MGFLSGQWLQYVDRTYQQIKESVLTRLQSKTPEITDHTESNPFVRAASVWSGIAEMEGYYIDEQGREALLDSARLYASGISHARRDDYRVKGKLSAGTQITFTLSAPLLVDFNIPIGTVVTQSSTGISFITVEAATITAGNTEIKVTSRQRIPVSSFSLGVSSGLPSQEVVVGEDIEDNSVGVKVNGIAWQRVESLAFSVPTDQHYVQTVSHEGEAVVLFGDGYNGAIPPANAVLSCDYNETVGYTGNIEAGSIDTLTSTLSPSSGTLSVSNEDKANGGYDVESLDDIKRKIPLWNRTNDRAVTPKDFEDITVLSPGVAKAGVIFNCGKTVKLYIVPQGGGIANPALISNTYNYVDDRKVITTKIEVFSAGIIRIKLDIDVVSKRQYYNNQTRADVLAALLEFGSVDNQDVKGRVNIGDVYQLIENLEKVQNSTIKSMTTVPYPQRESTSMPELSWDPVVNEGSRVATKWVITMVDATHFQVVRESSTVGVYTVGDAVVTDEITFKIFANGYNSGNTWTFVVYPYFGNIQLQEPSIPIIYEADINLNVTGGI